MATRAKRRQRSRLYNETAPSRAAASQVGQNASRLRHLLELIAPLSAKMRSAPAAIKATELS